MTSLAVSVIVPLFNGADFIEETLARVIAQTLRRFEVLVIDDGSTDDGMARAERIADQDGRVKVFRKPHVGIARTRNFGLANIAQESQYVCILDQDDTWPVDFLAKATDVLQARPDAVAAAALVNLVGRDGEMIDGGAWATSMQSRLAVKDDALIETEPFSDFSFGQLFLVNHLCPPSCVVFRREIITSLGGFDDAYALADDWDLVLRSLRLGDIACIAGPTVGYRRHLNNASTGVEKNISETRRVWARTYYSAENTAAQRAELRLRWRAHQAERAATKGREAWTALRTGKAFRATVLAMDAVAHILLARPLKAWR